MKFICKLLLVSFLIGSASLYSFAKDSNIGGVILKANEVYYDSKKDIITASGDVFIKMDNYTLKANKIHYYLKNDNIFAAQNVTIKNTKGNVIYGEKAVFKNKLKQGVIRNFIAKFDENSILVSRLAKRINDKITVLEQSSFTACDINCGKKPIWQINAKHTNLDYSQQKVTYQNLLFEVYGVPVMYLPYFSHPTPLAPAQSGFLRPRIKDNSIIVPFYLLAKPNLDFTFSPRFGKKYTIFQGEMRHKMHIGEYEIFGSYGNAKFKKTKDRKIYSNSNAKRYHILAKGNFFQNNINYGFNIKRASDKAYLVNYHNIYDSYLTSNIYVNKINKRDYFLLEGVYFQDLRSAEIKTDTSINSQLRTPFVFPRIRTQNIYSLNSAESLLFNIRNDTILYHVPNKPVARTSFDLELMNNIITNNGQIINLTLANRSDLYWTSIINSNSNQGHEVVWYRNIPEFRAKWRYPLIKTPSSKSNIIIEPIIMLILGKKYTEDDQKFALIDPPKSEISENNIFSPNSFSGIDIHDYGNRLSYGVNSSFISKYLYLDIFLGQMMHKNNVTDKKNADYVGSIRAAINSDLEFFYRFRADSKFKPIRNEIGISANMDKLTTNVMFTELHNLSTNFAKKGFAPEENKTSQMNIDMKYQLNPNLSLDFSSQINISHNSTKTLVRTIGVTYLFDCVSITGSITDNFLHDSLRGVKKSRSKSFSIGLKSINM